MGWARKLLADEVGAVVSAEMALLVTTGLLGASAGLESVSESVNSELHDFASALRGLNQNYSVSDRHSDRALVAASWFEQPATDADTANVVVAESPLDRSRGSSQDVAARPSILGE